MLSRAEIPRSPSRKAVAEVCQSLLAFAPAPGQSSPVAVPDGRAWLVRPATCCSFFRGAWGSPQWIVRSRYKWCHLNVEQLWCFPKVTELPVTIHIDRRPDDVIMNMRFVDVGADHKGMIAFGEPPGKFYAQPVGFLRCDLSGPERLAHMVGDHIICTAHLVRWRQYTAALPTETLHQQCGCHIHSW